MNLIEGLTNFNLTKQEATLRSVVERMQVAGGEQHLDQKRAVRLTNAINRLASDLEYLKMKWDSDAD